jgi:hypothetical protein
MSQRRANKNKTPKKTVRRMIKSIAGRDYHSKACLRALLSPQRGPTPFPDRMRAVLTYSQQYTLMLSNSASVARQQFSMNSLFDPDFTGTGAQPEFFDQLSALYNRYRCYGSAIKVTLIPFNAGSQINVPVAVVLVPTALSLASSSYEDAAGLPRAQNRISTGNMDYKNQTLVASHSISEILGVKDVEGADRLQALITASPAEQALWAIVARTVDGVTATSLAVSVRITYDVEFFDRQIATQSLLKRVQEESKVEHKLSLSEEAHLKELRKNVQDIEDFQKLHANVPTLRGRMPDKWLKVELDASSTPSSRTKVPSLK